MDQNAYYTHVAITNKGYDYIRTALTGKTLKFTKIQLGEGELDDAPVTERDSLINYVMDMTLTSVTRDGDGVIVEGKVTSDDILAPFNLREIGIYASIEGQEALFAYLHSGDKSERLTPSSGGQVSTHKLKFAIGAIEGDNVEIVFNDVSIGVGSITEEMLSDSAKDYITGEVNKHSTSKITDEDGVHGLRIIDGKLQYYNPDLGDWEVVAGVGGGGVSGGGANQPPEDAHLGTSSDIDIKVRPDSVVIRWRDAEDNGVVTWSGTRLVRKEGSAPQNENDGVILLTNTERDKYYVTPYKDELVKEGATYYYAVFPYDQYDRYNLDSSNIENILVDFPVVTNDITEARVYQEYGKLGIRWRDPNDRTDAKWVGTKVIKKVGSMPIDETDGEEILHTTTRNQYVNTTLYDEEATEEVPYYYGIFPYSADRAFNYTTVVSGCPATGEVYSFKLDFTQPDPLLNITYLDDAAGYTTPESWDDCPLFKAIKPCVMKDGEVQYYLNPDNYDQKLDGTPSNLEGFDGDVMVEFPFIAFRVENFDTGETTGNNIQKIKVSISTDYRLSKSESWTLYHMQYDDTGLCSRKFYNSVYLGSKSSSKIESIVKLNVNDIYSDTVRNINTTLPANTFITHVMYYYLMWFMMVMRYKTTHINKIMNLTNTGYKNYTIGDQRLGGLFSGCGNSSLNTSVKMFGSEYTDYLPIVMGGIVCGASYVVYDNALGGLNGTVSTKGSSTRYGTNHNFKRNNATWLYEPWTTNNNGGVIGCVYTNKNIPHFSMDANSGHSKDRGSCMRKTRGYVYSVTSNPKSSNAFACLCLTHKDYEYEISHSGRTMSGDHQVVEPTNVFNSGARYCFHFTYLPPVED